MCDMTEEQLRECFNKHACPDGKLTKGELLKMLKEKMGDDCKGAKNCDEMTKVFCKLEQEKDEKLDFDQFKKALACIKQVKEGATLEQVQCSK